MIERTWLHHNPALPSVPTALLPSHELSQDLSDKQPPSPPFFSSLKLVWAGFLSLASKRFLTNTAAKGKQLQSELHWLSPWHEGMRKTSCLDHSSNTKRLWGRGDGSNIRYKWIASSWTKGFYKNSAKQKLACISLWLCSTGDWISQEKPKQAKKNTLVLGCCIRYVNKI